MALFSRSVSENTQTTGTSALFPQLFVICKILSSEYQLYACGKIFQMPRFEKKLLFSDKLLGDRYGLGQFKKQRAGALSGGYHRMVFHIKDLSTVAEK